MSASYRSDHPDVLAVWQDTQARYRVAHEAIAAFKKKYGGEALVYRGSTYALAAIRKATPPKGGELAWRYDRKAGGWVPRRSAKEGKAIAKEFDACGAHKLGDVPGLPRYVQVVHSRHPFDMQGPAVFEAQGYVWAYWTSVDHEDVLKSGWGKLDEALWQQVKRSELEAARESMEEARAS